MAAGKIIGGIILIVIGILIFFFSYNFYNIQTTNISNCNSIIGGLGQLFSPEGADICARAPSIQLLSTVGIAIGVIFAITGIIVLIIGATSKREAKNKDSHKEVSKENPIQSNYCRYCGRTKPLSITYCPSCGRSSQASSTSMKSCSCGSIMSQDSTFCASCGKQFSNNETENIGPRDRQDASQSIDKADVDESYCNDASCERTKRGEKHPVHSSITYTRSTNRISRTTWVLIGIGAAIVVVVGGIIYSYTVTEQGYIQPSQLYTEPTPAQPASQIVVQESIALEAGYYKYYQFSTPPNADNVRLGGSVGVTGGIVPQILIYVMDASQCAPPSGGQFNLQGCNSYYVNGYYNDGASVDTYLPAGATFYLAFSNDAVLGERKIVDASFTLESE